MKATQNIKEIEINDLVFLFNDGKHIVQSFTKTSIRFMDVKTNKIQTINKNTFLKNHSYCDNYWKLIQKIRIVNMDFI